MLDLILAHASRTECPSGSADPILVAFYDLHRCSGSILDFPDHTGEGPFLRDSVLLFYSVGELAISQNRHHERIKADRDASLSLQS